MKTQKIINLLNDSGYEESKFATKMWYVMDSKTAKGKYKQGDTIKFETESIKSSLCDYTDAYILVTGDITVAANNDTDIALKNCAPFLLHARQKLMMCLLTKKIMFTLQCLCTIWLNVVIIIQGDQEDYDGLK